MGRELQRRSLDEIEMIESASSCRLTFPPAASDGIPFVLVGTRNPTLVTGCESRNAARSSQPTLFTSRP